MAGSNGYEVFSNNGRSRVLISLHFNGATHNLDQIEEEQKLGEYRREGPIVSKEDNGGIEILYIYERS